MSNKPALRTSARRSEGLNAALIEAGAATLTAVIGSTLQQPPSSA